MNIGVAAQITAASSGGPRYDASLTTEQRRSIDNGIWLCQNCATLVDKDEPRHPVAVLRGWKREAERSALLSAESGGPRILLPSEFLPVLSANALITPSSQSSDGLLIKAITDPLHKVFAEIDATVEPSESLPTLLSSAFISPYSAPQKAC